MNWLRNIFKRKTVVVVKSVQVVAPLPVNWTATDQLMVKHFLASVQGRKFIETCRHKLFSDHLDACQKSGNAETHNASMRGANNILSHIIYLAQEDSISGMSPVKEPEFANQTQP